MSERRGRPAITTPEPVALPEPELLARVFRTLGDRTRLAVVEHLRDVGHATQRELIDHLGVAQPRLSEHLACLNWCGFVHAERQGRSVHYRLADTFAEEFVDFARRFLDENANAVGCCTVLQEEEKPSRRSR